MILNNKKKDARRPKCIELENNLIEVVSEFKLLGCTIDENLSFNQHIKNFYCHILIIVPLYLFILTILK